MLGTVGTPICFAAIEARASSQLIVPLCLFDSFLRPSTSLAASMAEKRVDPATKEAVTYKELVAAYKASYKKKEIEEYWDSCKPAIWRNGRRLEGVPAQRLPR